jgi:hypothetical protein
LPAPQHATRLPHLSSRAAAATLQVAEGSISLDHNSYVKGTWPSNQRWNFWAAKCKGAGCNILDSAHLTRLKQVSDEINAIVINGDKIVKEYDGDYLGGQPERQWAKYGGSWSFDSALTSANNSKCFKWGPYCASAS